MRSKKLKNAPLKEALFELSWQSPMDNTGFPVDKDFDLAQGKFATLISSEFPVHKRTIPVGAPVRMYGRPIHQFWKGEVYWPVIQLGPGILTINDTEKNYEWDKTYRPTIHKGIDALINSYENSLSFNKVSLKYIDSVDLPIGKDPLEFISTNLQINVVNNFGISSLPIGVFINQIFLINGSQVGINIQTAVNNLNGSQAIIWITTVEKSGTFSIEEIMSWTDDAHTIASDLFVKMLNPKFYASFNQ